MSTQPDKIDELVRDWYDRQAMSGARVQAIRRSARAVPMRQTRMVATAFVVALAAMLTITGVLLNHERGAAASRLLAAGVVRLHQATGEPGTMELATMTGLGFTPVVPERCKKEGYKLVGARYGKVGSERAVEIRVIDDDGLPQTLCEFPGDRRAAELTTQIDGVRVSVWREAGLVMAMTGGD
jgi:hypothetical protein